MRDRVPLHPWELFKDSSVIIANELQKDEYIV